MQVALSALRATYPAVVAYNCEWYGRRQIAATQSEIDPLHPYRDRERV